jgi:hypothetical protein
MARLSGAPVAPLVRRYPPLQALTLALLAPLEARQESRAEVARHPHSTLREMQQTYTPQAATIQPPFKLAAVIGCLHAVAQTW